MSSGQGGGPSRDLVGRKSVSTVEPPDWMNIDHRVARAANDLLKATHARNAASTIEEPDEAGAFPASWHRAGGLLGEGVPPVVVDASTLRNDIGYACRERQRTVLVTAANSGAVRLFAASHVVAEVFRNAQVWAEESSGVTPAAFLGLWRSEYLPLIRVISDKDLPQGLLNPIEVKRVKRLELAGSHDIPSVTLALSLGAFFLSEDGPALRAVYGDSFDWKTHHAWLQRLMAGGDASELGKMVFAAGAMPVAVGAGVVESARWLSRRLSPGAAVAIGLLLTMVLARQASAERWQRLRSVLSDLGLGYLYLYLRYQHAYAEFRRVVPAVPSWEALSETNERHFVLLRACLHSLARWPGGHRSARQLAEDLPSLDIGQGEALVRDVLRASKCFHEPYQGRWQVGRPETHSAVPVIASFKLLKAVL